MWAFSTIFGWTLFYFFLRESHTPAHITTAQQLFLVGYALLLGSLWGLSTTRYLRRLDGWSWFNSRGKRWVAYFAGALVLEGIVSALRLPSFYTNVFQHSVYFLLLPLFIGHRDDMALRAWMDGPQAPVSTAAASAAESTESELILTTSRRKPVFVLLCSLAFVLGGCWTVHRAPVVGWACILFFGLGIPASLLMFIPGSCCLVLRPDGFLMRRMWRRWFFRWDEVADFTVVQGVQGPRVAWNITRPGTRRSAFLREMYGRDLMLPDNYGLSAQDLCAMMTERRDHATVR